MKFIIDLFHITGSPGVFEFVKAPIISPGDSSLINTRSSLLFFFKPQCVIETLIPSIVLIFVNNFGAKGEIFEGMVLHLTKPLPPMLGYAL